MPSTELVPRRERLSPRSGPRSRTRLNRLGHQAITAPNGTITGGNHLRTAAPEQLRMIDLFAGMGGFHEAFRRIGARCVFACEKNPTARRIYEANFSAEAPELFAGNRFSGDIAKVSADEVPDHDVLTAGFPCQPFSIAGKRRGFGDERGLHIFDIARILLAKRPPAFFLENVKGLLRHDGGNTFEAIRSVICDDLGYSLHTKVIRACDFGLPQLRPRLFMVGFRDPSTPFEFPEPEPLTTTLGEVLGGECERTVSRTLLATGHDKPYGKKFNWAHNLVDGRIRRLTPREALALQGYPTNFALPESYNAAMRLIGNSVAVPAATATGRQIARSLGFAKSADTLPEVKESRR